MLNKYLLAFLRSERGTSVLEFAFSVPLLIFVILYGGYESWRALAASLRVDRAASHVSTVAARADASLDEGALTSLLKSANTIASPTDMLLDGRVILSAVKGGSGGVVLWQRCLGSKTSFTSAIGTAGSVANLSGNSFPTPPEDTTALVAETFYEHKFFLTGSITPPVTLTHKAISLGREEIPESVLSGGTVSSC
jgi:Flp pilus assembly protein TadG